MAPGPRAPASTSRLTSRGGAEAALLALGSGRGRRRGFARSPAAHLPRVAQFLTGHGPGLVHGPEVGTPALDRASRTEPRGNSPLSHSPVLLRGSHRAKKTSQPRRSVRGSPVPVLFDRDDVCDVGDAVIMPPTSEVDSVLSAGFLVPPCATQLCAPAPPATPLRTDVGLFTAPRTQVVRPPPPSECGAGTGR